MPGGVLQLPLHLNLCHGTLFDILLSDTKGDAGL